MATCISCNTENSKIMTNDGRYICAACYSELEQESIRCATIGEDYYDDEAGWQRYNNDKDYGSYISHLDVNGEYVKDEEQIVDHMKFSSLCKTMEEATGEIQIPF